MKSSQMIYGRRKPWIKILRLIQLIFVLSLSGLLVANAAKPSLLLQQERKIYGKVTDTSGEPLPGVSVMVKGTTIGITTDDNGNYALSNVPENATLVFSFLGMKQQEINIEGRTTLNVEMSIEEIGINEVVVVGYGTQRKKDITGSVAIVDLPSLKSNPTGSAPQALQGLAAGVTVISSGVPGGRNDVFIRGISSFGNTAPLVIVDGVPGDMDNLNIRDIETMQVLKDAGAASIYGVRGSNGVIIITTSKGRKGKSSITYDGYYGTQRPKKGNVFNLMNTEDYGTIYKMVNPGTQLFANGVPDYTYAGPGVTGVAMEGDPAVDPSLYSFNALDHTNDYLIQKVSPGTDWFHEIMKPARIQSHNITASGGSDQGSYLFSLGYLDQKGTLIHTYLERYSIRVNTQYNISDHVRIGENLYGFYRENAGFSNMNENNGISQAYRTHPAIPVYDIRGNFGGTWLGPEMGTVDQPVADLERTKNDRNKTWNITGNAFLEIDFLSHFTARSSFGGTMNHLYTIDFEFNRYNAAQFHTSSNGLSEDSGYASNWVWTNTLNYDNTFGDHKVKALIGSEAIQDRGRSLSGGRVGFFSTDFNYLVLGNGTSNISNGSSAYKRTLFSLFTRADYSFKDKYLAGVTVRRDGSSVFGSENRYGVFPSFSVGWRISGEDFMKDLTYINDLKLRASYGVLGSQANIPESNAFNVFGSSIDRSYYDITGSNNSVSEGLFLLGLGNPRTGWEEDIITNIGLDATLFDNKLTLSLEWYKKSINGLLFPLPLPATAGSALSPTVNIGDIQNKGLDFSVGYHSPKDSEIGYSIDLNVTTYKNEVINIPDPGYFDVAGSRIGNLVRNQEGHPVGSFFGYEVIGLFRDDADVTGSPVQTAAAPGRFKYRDVNDDNVITPDDRTFFGNPNPDFTYGINIGVNYKNFDFATIFYGSAGNDVINNTRYYTDFMGSANGYGRSNVIKDAWRPDNLNAKVPKAEYLSSFSTNSAFNSYYMEDGSFFKLRSLILGYTIDPSLLQRYGVSKLRVYLQGANLFTITKYKGLDPELQGNLGGSQASASFGIDYGNYPNNQKNYLIGVSITF